MRDDMLERGQYLEKTLHDVAVDIECLISLIVNKKNQMSVFLFFYLAVL
jgi:hypothetical protein